MVARLQRALVASRSQLNFCVRWRQAPSCMQLVSRLLRRAGVVGLIVLLVRCDAPSQGPKAERGYRRAEPVIGALARFYADSGHYPDSLSQLVPAYLPAARLEVPAHPQERFPFEYRRAAGQYTLGFRYVGPGMNECTYHSAAATWDCSGYF